ncbi:MAG: Mu-like prophage major head subunit gpT family protein [Chloroflexota bacterium]
MSSPDLPAPTDTTPQPLTESGEPGAPDVAGLIEHMRTQLRCPPEDPHSETGDAGQNAVSSAELTKLVEEIRRERDTARAEALLASKLAEARLPEPVAQKLRRRFAGSLFESAVLEEAIAEEKDTLAALSSAGHISGNGVEKSLYVGMSDYDQLQAAFDSLFDIHTSEAARSVPRFSGIREAFRVATGVDIHSSGGVDRPIMESYAEGLRNKVRYTASRTASLLSGSDALLREADVTTASFSYLLGTSMNKRLLSDYQAWPSEWQKFTTIVGIKDFKQQDRVRLGAFGSLSTVNEDTAYTTLTVADTRAIYSATKRGNIVQITRETIINDDLYAIKQIPQKLAVAASFTLAEFVYGLLSPAGANIYDAHPLFDSVNHGNTGVTAGNLGTANSGAALTSANLQLAVIAMRKQKNLAAKPIGLKPRYLIVPPDLEFTAMTIHKSAGLPGGNNNDINPMMGYAEPIVSPQMNSLSGGPTSTTGWIAVADPRVIDTCEVGFVGGQANPVLLIQDMPLYGLNFTQDTISYKVRHEYGGAVVDYRGFYLGNN